LRLSLSSSCSSQQQQQQQQKKDEAFYNEGNAEKIFIDYKNITKVVKPGSRVYIDDGLLCLEVISTTDTEVKCSIVNSTKISSRKVRSEVLRLVVVASFEPFFLFVFY